MRYKSRLGNSRAPGAVFPELFKHMHFALGQRNETLTPLN